MGLTLADGVFDPLHSGHVVYLRACRKLGDRLIVQVSPQTKRAECVPWIRRMVAVSGIKGVSLAVMYETTAAALTSLRPTRYVKGADWRDTPLPEADLCRALGIEVCYVDTPRQSSTRLLQDWAARTVWDGLAAFEQSAVVQQQIPFDAAAQGYTYENRVTAEGEHPRILAGLCKGKSVLDVGCGPGHFVRMLHKLHVQVRGVDPQAPQGLHTTPLHVQHVTASADVVVCREVLEHLPVREIGAFLFHLFRVARERVYLTTRFTAAPRHPFDLTTEFDADPSHITLLPQPFIRALCVAMGGVRDVEWEAALDWQHKGRVLVYRVPDFTGA